MNGNRRALISAILVTTTATAAIAQGRGGPCTLGTELSYGISAIDCVQCTIRSDGKEHWTEYGTEPVVRGVMRSMNPIQAGDVLVAVDGKLITTAAGGLALSHPVAGQSARFTVRRAGKQIDLNLMPGTPCPIISPAAAADLAAAMARSDSINRTMTEAGRDSFRVHYIAEMARLRDTIEFRYERDAFGRPRNANVNGDTVKFGAIKTGRIEFQADGRGLFITDSIGARQFREMNRVPARSEQWSFVRADTLSDGTVRSIWNGGRDTNFAVHAGRRVTFDTAGRRIRFDAGAYGASSAEFLLLGANASARAIGNQHGWLGFGLDCSDCAVHTDSAGLRIWRFPTSPKVAVIEVDGPAQAAGMLAGDVLRAIDGVSITTTAGATRFAGLRAGDKVRLTVDRNGKKVDLVMTVAKVN